MKKRKSSILQKNQKNRGNDRGVGSHILNPISIRAD
jgi:hypothetical protein